MEKNLVGYRFHPTGEELINHYLKNKILGKSWLVDDAISEINICNYDPILLPSLSKIESKDPVWYFFSPREYASAKKTAAKRTTRSGFWKVTGVDRKIKEKSVVIGIKKTLVYHEGRVPNGIRTPWVMHEYHITCLPHEQRNYVICQVMYKGEEGDIFYGNINSSEVHPSRSLVSDSNTVRAINTSPEVEHPGGDNLYGLSIDDLLNPLNEQGDLSPSDGFNPDTFFSDYNNNNNNHHVNLQPQTPYDNEFWDRVHAYNGEGIEDVFSNPELIMQGNRNNHMAKKPLTGIIVGYSSDSDAESISATSYQGTASPNESVGSSNKYFPSSSSTHSFKELQTSEDPLINPKNREFQLARQEVKVGKSKAVSASIEKESSMAKTERKGLFITEEVMERNRKNPWYICLMNVIVGLILLVALLETSYRFY